ncbi:MAG: exodeoxyribonuclease VII small subunit [Parachlamydiales bacterium]|nr:exodeoxyribonuclease VII small subunit [Parachlamydiales bacterium]
MMQKLNFEDSLKRLEEIVDIINEGKISLDHSLSLFEEAGALIKDCNHYLNNAEQKIEMMIKNREKELVLDDLDNPQTTPFTVPTQN